MKKKSSLSDLSYRKKLLHLAKFYKIKEIKENLLKRRLTNKQIELLLKKNHIVLPNLSSENSGIFSWHILYKSLAASLLLIFVFSSLPLMLNSSKNNEKKLVQTKNKVNTLIDIGIKEYKQSEEDKALLKKNLKEDSDNSVRLSASTLEEIFQSANYDLNVIRKTKKVKPIYISILPSELSKIEDSRIKNAERTLHARMTPFEREEAARWTGMYRFLLDEDYD